MSGRSSPASRSSLLSRLFPSDTKDEVRDSEKLAVTAALDGVSGHCRCDPDWVLSSLPPPRPLSEVWARSKGLMALAATTDATGLGRTLLFECGCGEADFESLGIWTGVAEGGRHGNRRENADPTPTAVSFNRSTPPICSAKPLLIASPNPVPVWGLSRNGQTRAERDGMGFPPQYP